jgi:hypothetical protein
VQRSARTETAALVSQPVGRALVLAMAVLTQTQVAHPEPAQPGMAVLLAMLVVQRLARMETVALVSRPVAPAPELATAALTQTPAALVAQRVLVDYSPVSAVHLRGQAELPVEPCSTPGPRPVVLVLES